MFVAHAKAGHLAFFFGHNVRYDLMVETLVKIDKKSGEKKWLKNQTNKLLINNWIIKMIIKISTDV